MLVTRPLALQYRKFLDEGQRYILFLMVSRETIIASLVKSNEIELLFYFFNLSIIYLTAIGLLKIISAEFCARKYLLFLRKLFFIWLDMDYLVIDDLSQILTASVPGGNESDNGSADAYPVFLFIRVKAIRS